MYLSCLRALMDALFLSYGLFLGLFAYYETQEMDFYTPNTPKVSKFKFFHREVPS